MIAAVDRWFHRIFYKAFVITLDRDWIDYNGIIITDDDVRMRCLGKNYFVEDGISRQDLLDIAWWVFWAAVVAGLYLWSPKWFWYMMLLLIIRAIMGLISEKADVPVWTMIARVIGLPFMFVLFTLLHLITAFKKTWEFIKYGGEIMTLNSERNRRSIEDVYKFIEEKWEQSKRV